MMTNVKFKFYLKSGKTFECIEELSVEQFLNSVENVKLSMRGSASGVLQFEDCCVRLSECAVVEWEVLNES